MSNGIFDGKSFTQTTRLNVTDELRIRGVPVGPIPAAVLTATDTDNQIPTALDTPLQITFGGAQGTPQNAIQLLANGDVVINQSGTYQIISLFSVTRTTSTGEAYIFIRGTVDGVQFGNPLAIIMDDDEMTIPLQFVANAPLEAGNVIRFEMYRDSQGINNGQLSAFTSTIGWGDSSSASLRMFKFA